MTASAQSASDDRNSPDTVRLLETIEKTRASLTAADLRAAHRLNADGDRAYRQRDYSSAFTAYANSYPNAPNAYAYIMAGDAYWRGVLQHHANNPSPTAGASCRLDNEHFAHDLATDVAQHQAVGLALAVHDHDRRVLESGLYQRAKTSTSCLQDLARRYEAEAPTSCVDLDELNHCLGSPLVK